MKKLIPYLAVAVVLVAGCRRGSRKPAPASPRSTSQQQESQRQSPRKSPRKVEAGYRAGFRFFIRGVQAPEFRQDGTDWDLGRQLETALDVTSVGAKVAPFNPVNAAAGQAVAEIADGGAARRLAKKAGKRAAPDLIVTASITGAGDFRTGVLPDTYVAGWDSVLVDVPGRARGKTATISVWDADIGGQVELIALAEVSLEELDAGGGRATLTFDHGAALAIELERKSPPWIGVKCAEGDPAGLLVTRVVPGSPAEVVGILAGDTITAFDGKPTQTKQALLEAFWVHQGGDLVTVTITRDGVPQEVRLVLGSKSLAEQAKEDG